MNKEWVCFKETTSGNAMGKFGVRKKKKGGRIAREKFMDLIQKS